MPYYLQLSAETIAMGVASTIIGILFSLPVAFLASRNTTPGPIVYYVARGIVTFFRTVPEMVFALVFVVSFGMGPVAGVFCLTLGTFGMLTKFYSEAVESTDPKPVEALNATGSHRIGVIRHAILPQVIPVFTSYTLYMLDSAIRSAVMVGIVGAGGLGVALYTQMQEFHYQNVLAILIIIIVMVALINRTSAFLRKGIIEGTIFNGSRKYYDYAVVVIGGLICLASLYLLFSEFDFNVIVSGIPKSARMFSMFWPIDFSDLDLYISLMIETISMAISGTIISILLALPLGFLMARNVNKNSIIANGIREISNMCRAMPELVFAIFFVAAVGMGPFAGVLAIALHTAGVLGEFYAGAIENIDSKVVEAVEATGASFTQIIRHAIFPQIFPIFNSNNLYILDRNIRASSILGMVGAGGIGFMLMQTFYMFRYGQTMAIIIVMIVTILIVDNISAYLRRKVV